MSLTFPRTPSSKQGSFWVGTLGPVDLSPISSLFNAGGFLTCHSFQSTRAWVSEPLGVASVRRASMAAG
ncbi:hypothetical protein S83_045655 [Arachis hypogaea]